jgi:PAS domain S-box-containing protein
MNSQDSQVTITDAAILDTYQPASRRKALWVGLGIIALVAVAAIVWVAVALKGREAEFDVNLKEKMGLMAQAPVRVTDTLVENMLEQAGRVINSELFKLYAAEVHLIQDDVSLLVSGPLPGQAPLSAELRALSEQLPMMQNLLVEFTHVSDYFAGRVVNQNGTVFISTDAASKPLRSEQGALIRAALQSHKVQFGPLRQTDQGLMLDLFMPIFPPDASGLKQAPVAVLLLTKIAGEKLKAIGAVEQGVRTRLLQKAADGYQEVVPWKTDQLQEVTDSLELERQTELPFAVRNAIGGNKKAYSLGKQSSGPGWWIIVEADYEIAREGLRSQQKALMSIAVLLVVVFAVAFGAFWALLVSSQERKVAQHFEQLAEEIEKQRQLLDRINNTISDYIVLEDLQGRYRYVNPSFAEAVGRSPEELVGLDNEAVFGYDTARRLESTDQQVLSTDETYTFNESLYIQSNRHHLQISKSALKDSEGKITGIVSVIRDVTEIVEVQKRQEQATAKTVEALVRAIELIDPYLAGHSRLMGKLGVEVAKAMNASDLDIATIETAANLSQIGKLFVDRELLFKAEALTADEKEALEAHVEHAAKVLRDIDFGLPVFEAVFQMNETLDGKGYPKGLKADDLGIPARVLSVANSFCAMVEPRAYRGARSNEEVLTILEEAQFSYDQKVVAALKEVVSSAIGEKMLSSKHES